MIARDEKRPARPVAPTTPGVLDADGIVFLGPGAFEITRYRVDPPGPGEVRVRMAASGVCHSDLHVLDGHWARPAPLVMGHEGAGWVESVGPEAAVGPNVAGRPSVPAEPDATGTASPGTRRGPRLGDLVVLAWTAPCGRCAACLRGEGWLCLSPAGSGHRRAAGEVRIHRPDGSALGAYSGIGTMGSVQVVAADAAIPVDPRTDPAVAALIGCAVTTGVGAVTRTARVQPGQTVAVVGLGGVGLAAVLGARLAGARRIVAIDRVPAKLDRAAELGATDLLVAGADPGETAASLRAIQAGWVGGGSAGGPLVRCLRVDRGHRDGAGRRSGPAGRRPSWACRRRRPGWAWTCTRSSNRAPGSWPATTGRPSRRTIFGELARHAVDGSLPLDRLIEERIGLADVAAAFEALRRGDGARRVIVFPPG